MISIQLQLATLEAQDGRGSFSKVAPTEEQPWYRSVHQVNFILLPLNNQDSVWKKMYSLQSHNQGLHQLFFDRVLGLTCRAWLAPRCPSVFIVLEATHQASLEPMMGAVSALKSPSWAWDRDEGVDRIKNERDNVLPNVCKKQIENE